MGETLVILLIGICLGGAVGFVLGRVGTTRVVDNAPIVNPADDLARVLGQFKAETNELKNTIAQKFQEDGEKIKLLQGYIQGIAEQSKNISEETRNLTSALKNNKIQGNWGEIVLERILENAGLIKDLNFTTQRVLRGDANEMVKPDFIITLPDNKTIIIDAKVNITHFQHYLQNNDDGELKNHVNAIKNQVKDLADKSYFQYLPASPDFVMMFVPSEPALIEALKIDPNLFHYGLDRRVFIVSPSSLMLCIKLIHYLWQQDKIAKNSLVIAELGGRLYDKLAGFLEDYKKLGNQIQTVRNSYDESLKKLSDGRGNALQLADELRDKGAKASKELPVIGA